MTNGPSTPPPPGYYQQPPKKRRTWLWVLGGILLLMFVGMGACMALVGTVANEVDKESKREVNVTYQVEGTGSSVSVTYSGNDLNMAQDTGVSLPWSKQVTITGLLKSVTLTATNGDSPGSVTCRIMADGKQISEQTANGPFASASCSGDAGQS